MKNKNKKISLIFTVVVCVALLITNSLGSKNLEEVSEIPVEKECIENPALLLEHFPEKDTKVVRTN